jgi:hypothetical protein
VVRREKETSYQVQEVRESLLLDKLYVFEANVCDETDAVRNGLLQFTVFDSIFRIVVFIRRLADVLLRINMRECDELECRGQTEFLLECEFR